MAIERLHAHPAVAADQGQVALRRGPIVYCVEQADHDTPIDRLLLPDTTELTYRYEADLLGGVVALSGTAAALDDAGWEDTLYRAEPPATRPAELRAIPYYAWDNRAPGAMRVWLRRS
jgi:DUF1680 family protein